MSEIINNDKHNLVICLKCSWIHFTVTKEYIKNWQKEWKEYWPTLDKEGRDMFGLPDGPPTPESYYECFRCGTDYKNMRNVTDKDEIREGSTIQPICNKKYSRVDNK